MPRAEFHRQRHKHNSGLTVNKPHEKKGLLHAKQLYVSESAAIQHLRIIRKERGGWLEVYECPHKNGWYLTKG